MHHHDSNDYAYTVHNYYPVQSPQQKPRKKRWPWLVGIPAAGFLMLASCGTGGALMAGETEEIEVPGPTETVTPEPEVITETVTEEVEVEVAPDACGDALTAAEDVFQINGEALDLASDMIGHAGFGDTSSLEQATDDLNALQDPLEDALSDYYTNAAQCG